MIFFLILGQIDPPSQPNFVVSNQPKLGTTPVNNNTLIVQQPESASLPPKPPSQQNMFKLQRGRSEYFLILLQLLAKSDLFSIIIIYRRAF